MYIDTDKIICKYTNGYEISSHVATCFNRHNFMLIFRQAIEQQLG